MTTCLLCTAPLADREVRPYEDGFAHVDCAESLIFVYGTLRVGGHLEGWLPERLPREPATVTGFALHYAPHHGFPYLVKTGDDRDLVYGEIVTVPADDAEAVSAALSVSAMERSAGYEVEGVTAILKSGCEVLADAFVWPWPHRGERIESGDWTLTPEWEPWPAIEQAAFRQPEPAPAAPEVAPDERPRVRIGRDPETLMLTVKGLDGTRLWEGVSYTAMGRWMRERNLVAEKESPETA